MHSNYTMPGVVSSVRRSSAHVFPARTHHMDQHTRATTSVSVNKIATGIVVGSTKRL